MTLKRRPSVANMWAFAIRVRVEPEMIGRIWFGV